MNDESTRTAPWGDGGDEPTRTHSGAGVGQAASGDPATQRTTTHGATGGAVDDWYRSAGDESAVYGSHGATPADPGAPHGSPGYSSAGYSSAGYSSAGQAPGTYPSAGYAPAPAPQPAPARRGWIAPAALAVVAVASFGIVTVVMNHEGKSTADAPAVSSSVTTASSPGSAAPSTPSSSSNTATATVTETKTASQSATDTPSDTTAPNLAAFPTGATNDCRIDKEHMGHTSDPDVRQKSENSCDFLVKVKEDVWKYEAQSNGSNFDLQVYSAYRKSVGSPNPFVPLSCSRDGSFTHCTNGGDTPVNIWVRDKH